MKTTALFHSKTLISLALCSAIFLSGCATTGSTMVGNSADPRLTSGQTATFFSKSGYQACAVGAGAGVLACMVSNTSNKAGCAIAAGLVACGVAMGANYYLDDRRTQYADTTERLQVMTQDVQADTERVVQMTDVAQSVIIDDKALMAQIKQDMANKRVDMEKANKDLASVDSNIALLNKNLKNMQAKADEYSKAAQKERADGAGEKVKHMEKEIVLMNQKIALLRNEVNGLYDQRTSMTLG